MLTQAFTPAGNETRQMASPQQDGGGCMWVIWEEAETCRPSFLLSLWFKAVKLNVCDYIMRFKACMICLSWLVALASSSVNVHPVEIQIKHLCKPSAFRRSLQCLGAAAASLPARSPTPRLWFTAMDISPADCCCNLLRSIGYWSGRPGPAAPRCGEWTAEAVPVWEAKHRYHLQPETFISAENQIWVLKNQS